MKSKGVSWSEQQKFLVRQVQLATLDLKVEDEMIWRYLKHTSFNVSRAESMIRKTINWRQENEVDMYLHWKPPDAVEDDYKYQFMGQDFEGHSVIYLPIGAWQMKRVMEMGFKKESLEFRFHLLEKIMESIRSTRKTKFVMIMDMEGLTYRKCIHYETIQFLAVAFKDFEDHYPERLRACYVINAPWAFGYVYTTLKHVFSSKTLSKAKIFDTNSKKWTSVLSDKIPLSKLQLIKGSMYSQCTEGAEE